MHHDPFDNSFLPCAQVSHSSMSLNRCLIVNLDDFHHNLHDFPFLENFFIHLHVVDFHVDDVHHVNLCVDLKMKFYHLYFYFYLH